VTKTLAQAAQSTHALQVLKTSGLPIRSLNMVCRATMVARLTYASPSWSGNLAVADQGRIQAALNRAARWGLCSRDPLSFEDLCVQSDSTLFTSILSNPHHVLHPLLPPPKTHRYNLRNRHHPYPVPRRDKFTQVNFLRRMLYT